MQVSLTDTWIRNAKMPAKGRVMVVDQQQNGLQLRITDKGTKSFSVVTRGPDGKISRRTIGRYPDVSLREARRKAVQMLQEIREGRDPRREAAERLEAERAKQRNRVSVRQATERYIAERVSPQPTWSERYKENIRTNLRLAIGEMGAADLAISNLGKRELQKLISAHEGHNAVARHRLGDVSRFLDWCVDQEIIEINPAHTISFQKRPKAPSARSRVLSQEEIKAIWNAAGEIGGVVGDYVQFWLLVPARRGEIASMDWEHVDLANRRWGQPGKLTKNNEPHAFHLTDEAMRILQHRQQAAGGQGLVFASERSGGEIKGWSQIKKKLQNLTGTQGWTWHDMRRTFVSELAEAGCDIDLLDGILNHRQAASRGGVLGVYQKASRWPDKIKAMQTWSGIVDGLASS